MSAIKFIVTLDEDIESGSGEYTRTLTALSQIRFVADVHPATRIPEGYVQRAKDSRDRQWRNTLEALIEDGPDGD